MDASTLPEMLHATARARPDAGFRFHVRGRETAALSFGALAQDMEEIGAALARRIVPGQRVPLVFGSEPDFLRAFFAVLLAGGAPTPLAAPQKFGSLPRFGERLAAVARRSGADLVLAATALAPTIRAAQPADVPLEICDLAAVGRGGRRPKPGPGPSSAALVQYTSGSVSDPKGVVITHRNLLTNLRAMGAALAMDEACVGASWLPFFHDMGLIGGLLLPISVGATTHLMPPEGFVRAPAAWLRMISDHRAVISPAPDFAYRFCAERVSEAELEGLELSSWRIAINAAEPVRAATLDRFVARFGPAGFRREAFLPLYGLAEATLGVTFPAVGAPPRVLGLDRGALADGTVATATPADPRRLDCVACGQPIADVELAIDGAAGVTAAPGVLGEILVRGGAVTAGYDNDPAATEAAFADGWLRTGDLGFLADGQLFVVGRRKDVVIVGGHNYHLNDVEAAALETPGVLAAVAVRHAVEDGEACGLIVCGEASPDLAARVRAGVGEAVGLALHDVVFAAAARIPRTTSGKVRRPAAAELYARLLEVEAAREAA